MNEIVSYVLEGQNDARLFADIANDIEQSGYSIKHNALAPRFANALHTHAIQLRDDQFHKAGIGRGQQYTQSNFVRTDEICWINGESQVGQEWLNWTEALRTTLNRRLFLGLFSFESHFAHYGKGDFYKRHVDAFKGEANRVISFIAYLNPGWLNEDGGELILYPPEQSITIGSAGIKVSPLMGTIVAFLSEEFPHEVLPAQKDRYSIAGWFRLNSSSISRVDPDF